MQSNDPHAGKIHITAFAGPSGPCLAVICKQAFALDSASASLELRELAKLSPDLNYGHAQNRIGRQVRQGRDLWPDKEKIDLILSLDAIAPGQSPVAKMRVDVTFEEKGASALVMGDRHAFRHRGQLRFSEPECFERMPLDDFHAYGGIDPTLMPPNAERTPMVLGMPVPELFPGAYPLNPAGMGYWTSRNKFIDGLMLPNVERVEDLLTPERFFIGDPRRWPMAPRPICWGFQSLWSYPRCIYTNRRPYHLPDASDPDAFAALGALEPDIELALGVGECGISPKLMQQGNQELALSMRDGPLNLGVSGCFQAGPLQLVVPDHAPPIEILSDGTRQRTKAKRLAVHLDGRSHRLFLTWAVQCPLDQALAPFTDMRALMKRYGVVYDGHLLGEACWSPGRALLNP